MRVEKKRLAWLALCLLDEVREEAHQRPVQPSLAIRLALGYLYAIGDCERFSVDDFRKWMGWGDDGYSAGVARNAIWAAALSAWVEGSASPLDLA